MDYLATSSFSLFLRVLVANKVTVPSSQLIHPAILGLWEGVVLQRLSHDDPSSLLPLCKYITTLWIGHHVAQDSKHIVLLTVVWSAVGALLSQAVGNADGRNASRRPKRRVSTHARSRTRSDVSASRRVAFSPHIASVETPAVITVLQPHPEAPPLIPPSPLVSLNHPIIAVPMDPASQEGLSPRVMFTQPFVGVSSDQPTTALPTVIAIETRGSLSPAEEPNSANSILPPTSPAPLPVIMPIPKSILRLRASSSAGGQPMFVSGPETPARTDTSPEFFPPSPIAVTSHTKFTSIPAQPLPSSSRGTSDNDPSRPPSVLPSYPTHETSTTTRLPASHVHPVERKASRDESGKTRARPIRPTPEKISTNPLYNISNTPFVNGRDTPSESPPTYAPRSDGIASPCLPVPLPAPRQVSMPVPVLHVPPPKPVAMPVPVTAPIPRKPVAMPVPALVTPPVPAWSSTTKRVPKPIPASAALPHAPIIDRLSTLSLESTVSAVGKEALLKRADLYRDQARDKEAERDAALKQRRTAQSGSRVSEAFLLAMDARKADALAKTLHGKAERRYYLAHNEDAGKTPAVLGGAAATGPTIDVHRLFLAEAIRKTEDALCDAIRERQPELRVIVGRGSHSKGGKAVLRPALKAEMEKQGLSAQVDTKNEGVLILTWPT